MTFMLNAMPGVFARFQRVLSTATPVSRACSASDSPGGRVTSSAELAAIALDVAEVAVVPGEAFGTPGYLRLSSALADDELEEGLTRLGKLLEQAS